MVRDISEELGKKVILEMSGENIWVEKYIFDWVADPMIHLLRNAVDHGIEMPAERLAAGKPEEGLIRIDVAVISEELIIEVADDGSGIDLQRIKDKALEKQLVSPQELAEFSEADLMNLIFLPGFSTNETLSLLSGRGVGMDVVRAVVEEKLHGKVLLDSQMNQGLKVTLKVPLKQYRF